MGADDGAFDAIKDRDTKADAIIPLVHGEPITFGVPTEDGRATKGVAHDPATGGVRVVEVGDGEGQLAESELLVHDAHNPDPSVAFAISRLTDAGYLHTSPIGIFRQVERATYDDEARARHLERPRPRDGPIAARARVGRRRRRAGARGRL